MEVQFRSEMQRNGAKADGSAVHEQELARRRHRPELPQALVNAEGFLPPILARLDPVCDRTHAIIKHRRIDEAGPDIQHVYQFGGEIAEPPILIGRRCAITVIRFKRMIKLDHPRNESGRENADTSVIKQIDAPFIHRPALPHRIIAKVRVTMNNAVARKGSPPRDKHGLSNAVADVERMVAKAKDRCAVKPAHGEQAARAQFTEYLRHRDARLIAEYLRIEADMGCLAAIIEFFMQPLCNLCLDFARIDGAVHAAVNGENERKLLQI